MLYQHVLKYLQKVSKLYQCKRCLLVVYMLTQESKQKTIADFDANLARFEKMHKKNLKELKEINHLIYC
jgi:hypothetical protein